MIIEHSIWDDCMYFGSLCICISLGSYYKQIEDKNIKKNYGAGLGLLVLCLVCGHNLSHTIAIVWGNVVIIKCCEKRYTHLLSLAYTWTYLFFLHYNMRSSVYVTWIHQNLALRMVGVAYEITKRKERTFRTPSDTISENIGLTGSIEDLTTQTEPTAVDIITYAFFFIGIHKGPYYRWRVFQDHFESPFGGLGDCRIITLHKVKKALICAFSFILLRLGFPTEMYSSNIFYTEFGSDSRFMFGLPHLVMYFLKAQIMMMLCTSVCTEAGFGVYPAKCNPLPGHGPSTDFALLRNAALKTEVALEQEYNFSMLKCFENRVLLLNPRLKNMMRAFEMPTKYWFWSYTYKHTLRGTKRIRSLFTFMMWAIWCGSSFQEFMIAITTWLYIQLEDVYAQIYDTKMSSMSQAWNIGYCIMRYMYLVYIAPCLVLRDVGTVLRFYNSIYWAFHLVLAALALLSLALRRLADL